MIEVVGYKDPMGEGLYNCGITDERIVRCRDCKSFHRWDVSAIYGNHEHDTFFCSRFIDGMRMEVEPDGFCKWGELRGGRDEWN